MTGSGGGGAVMRTQWALLPVLLAIIAVPLVVPSPAAADESATWESQSSQASGDALGDIDFQDADHGVWVDAQRGGRAGWTEDGGETWHAVSFLGSTLSAVTFVGDGHVWAVGDADTIATSTDAGRTWQAKDGGILANYTGVAFPDVDTGWVVGWDDTMLATTDRGNTWVPQDTPTSTNLRDVTFVDPLRGWAVGDVGTLLATLDAGESWVAKDATTTERLLAVDFVDASYGWVVGDAGTILHTRDAGETWAAQPSGTSERLAAVAFVDRQTGWTVGANGMILHTVDGGTTWNIQASGTTRHLNGISFVDGHHGWAAGNAGTVLAYRDDAAAGEAPVFTAADPPATATVGIAYEYTFMASGLPEPTFDVSSGALPDGLVLDANSGSLAGTPTEAGPFVFEVTATNGVDPDAVTAPMEITVSDSDPDPLEPLQVMVQELVRVGDDADVLLEGPLDIRVEETVRITDTTDVGGDRPIELLVHESVRITDLVEHDHLGSIDVIAYEVVRITDTADLERCHDGPVGCRPCTLPSARACSSHGDRPKPDLPRSLPPFGRDPR